MRRGIRAVLFLVAVTGLLTSLTLGTTVRTVNLPEMVEYSQRVFYGKCLSIQSALDPDTGLSVREYRFLVLEGLKGAKSGEEISVRQLLGMGQRHPVLPGLPQYRKGQKLLLFLHGDSRLGLTSPVGMAQGIFRPERRRSGEVGFVNRFRNRNLASEIRRRPQQESALSPEELKQLDSGEPIPLGTFRNMVERLERAQKRVGER
jgi:hypothetical protein